MHVGGAVLIVAALVAAESTSALDPSSWVVRVFAVAAGGLAVVLAAAAISGLVAAEIRQNPDGVKESLRGYSHLRKIHTGIWFVVSLSAVMVFQWPQWIAFELHRFVVIDELLVLLPVVMPMFFSHAAFFEVDRAAARVLGDNSDARYCRNRWSYAAWFARHEFGLVVLPLSALFWVRDAAQLAYGADAADGAWPMAVLSLLAVVAGLPLLLRYVWPCEPVTSEELNGSIAAECGAVGQRAPRLFRWDTGGRVVNALLTGAVPRMQSILLSDALLDHFSQKEILAVVRHELAHARHHHVLLRIAAMTTPLALLYAAGMRRVTFPAYQGFAGWHPQDGELAILAAVALGLFVYARWIFGTFSRLLELEADLVGCATPDQAESAYRALSKLGCVYGLDRRSWLHPTIRLRLRVLRAARRRAAFRGRLLARTRRWKHAVLIAFLAALLGCL